MAKIIIGKEYEKAFKSIVRLVSGGCIPPEIVKSATENEIVTDAYTFEYSGDVKVLDVAGSAARAEGMTEEGAAWFASLRGKKYDDGTAVWLNLIESVAAGYHRRYSLIEYKQNVSTVTDEEKERCRGAIARLCERFFPDLPAAEVREGSRADGIEDIYGVSVRIELSGGTGAAVPVLGKVYFRRNGNKMLPMPEEEARRIDEYLYEVIPTGGGKTDSSDASDTIDAVLGGMENLLYGKTAGFDFTDCICFSGEEDANIVNELIEKVSHDNVRLECRAVDTLGISHVRWISTAYYVYSAGKAVMRASVGLNESISLYCMNCGGGALIENNRIAYTETDENGEEKQVAAVIVPSREDLGITEEEAEKIAENSELSRHLQRMACTENPRVAGGCSRLVCAAQTENLGTEDSPVYKCKDCPYPEVVFVYEDGTKKYTPRLAFARDKMTLIEKEDAAVCDLCGRPFSKEYMHGRECAFCRAAVSVGGAEKELAKKRYKKYAQMFSPLTRLKYAKKQKLCFEEEDILLFLLGEDAYTLDKLTLKSGGYLAGPRKVK